MIMQAISSSEASVLTKATRLNILEDGILHSHRRDNLKSYNSISEVPFDAFKMLLDRKDIMF
jgi:hypothetical protein